MSWTSQSVVWDNETIQTLSLRLCYYGLVLQIMISWILTPCSLVYGYQYFGGHSAFICRVDVSFSTHKTALYHNLQGLSLIKPCHKNLKTFYVSPVLCYWNLLFCVLATQVCLSGYSNVQHV